MNHRYQSASLSLHRKREEFKSNIRRKQLDEVFESKRYKLIQLNQDELFISDLKETLKKDPTYFKNISQVLNDISQIIKTLHSSPTDTTTLSALVCLTLILRKNKQIYYNKIINTEPRFYHFLFQLMLNGHSKIRLKVLNIFNWLASEYQTLSLPQLWSLNLIDTLNQFLRKNQPTANFYRLTANLIYNMVSDHQTSIKIVKHPILQKIVSLMMNPDLSVQAEVFSCIQKICRHLEPQQLNSLLKLYKIISVACFRISFLPTACIHIGIDALRIIKIYIQANAHNGSDFNPAVHELQSIYSIEGILNEIAFSSKIPSGPVLTLLQLIDEILDIIGQCVSSDAI